MTFEVKLTNGETLKFDGLRWQRNEYVINERSLKGEEGEYVIPASSIVYIRVREAAKGPQTGTLVG